MKTLMRFLFSSLFIFSIYANATATATVDRNSITMNETFQLNLSLDERSLFGGPDISVLANNFDVVNTQKSSQFSSVNGQNTATTVWIYTLAPKQPGIFTIPAIDLDGQQTNPISIEIKPAKTYGTNASSNDPIFMEQIIDKETLFVQEQLLLTVYINSNQSLHDLQLTQFSIPDAIIVQVSNTQYQRVINNIPYQTFEVVYSVFPQASGVLKIPEISAEAIVSDGSFFGQGQRVRMRTNAQTAHVREIPQNMTSNQWLPAQKIALSETWSANPDNLKVGDSITRTITTTAIGLGGAQIPPITMTADTHFKTYPDKPEINDIKNNTGITGSRKDTIAIIATEAGDITLPEISLEWWDVTSQSLKTERLPEVTLKVTGDPMQNTLNSGTSSRNTSGANSLQQSANTNLTNTPSSSPMSGISPDVNASTPALFMWQIATAISAILAAVFFILWVLTRQKIQHKNLVTSATINLENSPASTLLRTLKKACSINDIATIRSTLLQWAKLYWPTHTFHSMNDVARQFNHPEFQQWIQKLDASLYTQLNEESKTKENWLALYTLVENKNTSMAPAQKQKLAPLYPT